MNKPTDTQSFTFLPNINNPYGGGYDHIVHATGCGDKQCRQAERFKDGVVVVAKDLAEAERIFRDDWYSDFDDESRAMFSADIKPCARRAA